jgi:hypothetical protein
VALDPREAQIEGLPVVFGSWKLAPDYLVRRYAIPARTPSAPEWRIV